MNSKEMKEIGKKSIDLFIPDEEEVQYISTCVKGLVKIEIRVIEKPINVYSRDS